MKTPEAQPKVSIRISTYNQGKFIAQAIESVLMQEVDFSYEIIIGEDCSTDNTREIVTTYQQKYPDRIRLLLYEQNMGRLHNFKQTLMACSGQYIASLDGDDYWTSPHKLQKQANFLDDHPDCSMCFHNVQIVYDSGKESHPDITRGKPFVATEDLLNECFIASCGVMYRNPRYDVFPPLFDEMPVYDWPLYVLNSQKGRVGYIDEIMGVWRHHADGIWTKGGKPSIDHLIMKNEWALKFYEVINRHLEYRYDTIIQKRIAVHRGHIEKLQQKKTVPAVVHKAPLLTDALVTVITPTTGLDLLEKNLFSVSQQTYKNIQHLLVVDGPDCIDRTNNLLRQCGMQMTNDNKAVTPNGMTDVLYLPYATGGEDWLENRIYGACCYLAKGDYLLFLKETNFLEPDHVESLLRTLQEKKVRWAYSLRRILDSNGAFVCNDDCESLGKWPSVLGDNDYLIDTNCFFLPKTLAVETSHAWNNKAPGPERPGADRILTGLLKRIAPDYECSYNYSVNYRTSLRAGSVQKEFFLRGNEHSVKKYAGNLPWRKAGG